MCITIPLCRHHLQMKLNFLMQNAIVVLSTTMYIFEPGMHKRSGKKRMLLQRTCVSAADNGGLILIALKFQLHILYG